MPQFKSVFHFLAIRIIALFCVITSSAAIAGTTLVSPSVANGSYVNGVLFTVTTTSDVARVELSANGFAFGTLNATNNWQLRYTFTNIGSRDIAAKSYSASNGLLSTNAITINVVDVLMRSPTAGGNYVNGAPVRIGASAVVNYVVLKAETFEIGRGGARDSMGDFVIPPALMNTIGSRTLNVEAFNGDSVRIATQAVPVTVTNTAQATCQFSAWTSYNGVSLRRHSSGAYIYKTANKNIDADGAPNAYHPADVGKTCSSTGGLLGLDCPANAGYPNGGFWRDVLVVDPTNSNKPYVQPSGTYAGFFISKTSLQDTNKAVTDIARYVNSTTIPYVVFPGNFYSLSGTGRMGDIGYVINLSNNKKTHYVAADVGPASAPLGEMSIAMQVALGGINPNPINGAGAPSGTVLYVGFPNSTATYAWPMTNAQMSTNIQQLLSNVGGEAGILACQSAL
jgi:hypothetical protein